jgi:hypothetical protein
MGMRGPTSSQEHVHELRLALTVDDFGATRRRRRLVAAGAEQFAEPS